MARRLSGLAADGKIDVSTRAAAALWAMQHTVV
jgi:hypothetical protein